MKVLGLVSKATSGERHFILFPLYGAEWELSCSPHEARSPHPQVPLFVFKLIFSLPQAAGYSAKPPWWQVGGLAGPGLFGVAKPGSTFISYQPREKSPPEERILFRAEKLGHIEDQ